MVALVSSSTAARRVLFSSRTAASGYGTALVVLLRRGSQEANQRIDVLQRRRAQHPHLHHLEQRHVDADAKRQNQASP